MKAFITGGLGFLGSHLVDRLVADGHHVTVFDNWSTGRSQFANPKALYVKADLRDGTAVTSAMAGCDTVFHLSANADIKGGWSDPTLDVRQNILATSHVLEAMRANGVKRIAFASSDAVYGAAPGRVHEDCPWPTQISLYGASKVAGEALVQAYAAGQGFEAFIFRFCPLVGERYTHGHIFDFVKRLLADPTKLEVRGTGAERKCKVHVSDAVGAVLHCLSNAKPGIYNVAPMTGPTSVLESIRCIGKEMDVEPTLSFTEKVEPGYSSVLWPDAGRIYDTGWWARISTEDGVRRTVRWLLENRWALERT